MGKCDPPTPEYETIVLEEVRCPECGNENGISKTQRANKTAQPVPPEHSGSCPECGHCDDPLVFHNAWERERMSEEELEQMRAERERAEDQMADWQHSAHYFSLQREP